MPGFKIYYTVTVSKIMWYGGKETYQCHRRKSQNRATCVWTTDSDKGRKTFQWRRIVVLINVASIAGYLYKKLSVLGHLCGAVS